MLPREFLHLTSTPFNASHAIEDSGYHSNSSACNSSVSGYHSNSSACNSSVDSSLAGCHFKLHSIQTPETTDSLLDSVSISSRELGKNNQSEICDDYYAKYRQTFFHVQTPNDSANHASSASSCKKKSEGTFHSLWKKHLQSTLIENEYVDFIYYLGERSNQILILRKILDYLNDEDLYNAVAVSRLWKSIILSIPAQRKRYRIYSRKIELTKENRMGTRWEYETYDDKNVLNSRATLTEIQNINRNSPQLSAAPPVVCHNYRFEAYQTEAQKLKLGKRLFSCPKCKLPSHVDENNLRTAICINSTCRYRFCILCHCVEHPSEVCHFISTPMVRKQPSLLGTQTSKRNLKRLLL